MSHHLRHMGSDVARALVVLALIFLGFAHAPVGASAPVGSVLTATVDQGFCGDLPDDGSAHAPCHACRIGGGADLPPVPCLAVAAPVAAAPVDWFPAPFAVATTLAGPAARPRAPPAYV